MDGWPAIGKFRAKRSFAGGVATRLPCKRETPRNCSADSWHPQRGLHVQKLFLPVLLFAACSSRSGPDGAKRDAGPHGRFLTMKGDRGPKGDAGAMGAEGPPTMRRKRCSGPKLATSARRRNASERLPARHTKRSRPRFTTWMSSTRMTDTRARGTRTAEPDELNVELKFCLDQAKTQLLLDTTIVERQKRRTDGG
jgi:hypothetical protein